MSAPARKRSRLSASQECVTAFLVELAETGAVALAAERAGLHRSTFYALRQRTLLNRREDPLGFGWCGR